MSPADKMARIAAIVKAYEEGENPEGVSSARFGLGAIAEVLEEGAIRRFRGVLRMQQNVQCPTEVEMALVDGDKVVTETEMFGELTTGDRYEIAITEFGPEGEGAGKERGR